MFKKKETNTTVESVDESAANSELVTDLCDVVEQAISHTQNCPDARVSLAAKVRELRSKHALNGGATFRIRRVLGEMLALPDANFGGEAIPE